MPRNSAGIYALPLPPVVTGTPIAASFENTTDGDIATELTNSLDRNGRGGMLAPFKIADGTVAAPGMAFTQDADNGIYRIGPDDWGLAVAGTKLMEFTAGAVALAGTLAVTGALTVSGAVNAAAGITGPVTGNVAGTVTGGVLASWPNQVLAIGTTGAIAPAPGNSAVLEVRSATGADAAFMSFHRVGTYAAYFGIDSNSAWTVGGWSMGANSYRLLHEGNSFTLDPDNLNLSAAGRSLKLNNLTASGIVTAAGFNGPLSVTNLSVPGTLTVGGTSSLHDAYVSRNATSGAIFFGTDNARYIYQDGASWRVTAVPLVLDAGLSVNWPGTAPLPSAVFQVRTGANANFIVKQGTNYTALAAYNDDGSSYQNMQICGSGKLVPMADNLTDLGMISPSVIRFKQVYAFNTSISSSDARNKTDVLDSPLGLDFINALRPVAYRWIVGENRLDRVPAGEEPVAEHWDIDGTHHPASTRTVYKDVLVPLPGVRTHFGLIAQEVAQAVQASGVADFAGYIQGNMDDPNSELGLRYSEFIGPIIKAVQQLTARVAALEAV